MKKLVCAVVALVCGVSLAADLRWVNWDGDLKAGTASNWEPAQVPQAGDNLTIFYNGSGTKYWHNDLDIEYGHITVVLTNTSNTRVDFDQKEVRVTNGFSVLGQGGTFYPRTAITGTGEFLQDNENGTTYLVTSPSADRVYSGDFVLKRGTLNANAANVLGNEASHGTVTIIVHKGGNFPSEYGKLTTSGSWSFWNDLYYDNTSGSFAFMPDRNMKLKGKVYFSGGGATLQCGGSGSVFANYGKWIKWTPEGRSPSTTTLQMHVDGSGVEFLGGFEDPYAALTIYSRAANKVTLSSDVVLPYGVLFQGAGTLLFGRDNVSANPLPVSMKASSVVDLAGTSQKIGDIALAAGATTASITDSVGGGEFVWTPSADDQTFPSIFSGDLSLTLDAADKTTTLGSTAVSGKIGVKAGTLLIPADAELPNVTGWSVAANATLDIRASGLSTNGVLRLDTNGTLLLAQGVVLTVFKAYVGGTRLTPGDYTYGDGILRVREIEYAWTGAAGDGDLVNPANWNYNEIPIAEEKVRIASDGPLALGGMLSAGTLTIGVGTAITLDSGSVLSAGSYVFGEGAQIVSESATLEFTDSGTYAALPISEGVAIRVAKGTLTFAANAEIPNLRTLSVAAGATLDIRSSALPTDGVLELDADATLTIAQGTVFTVFKAFVGGERLDNGDYTYGEGTLRVHPVSAWTGAAGDGDLANPANWAYGELPEAMGNAVIFAAEPLDLHGTLTVASLTLGAGTVVNLTAGSLLSADGYVFGEGASIVSESAVLAFTGDGTYSTFPKLKGVVVRITDCIVTFASETVGGGALCIEVDSQTAVEVTAGVTLPIYTFKVGDTYVNPGTIQAGAGHLAVYTKPSEPAAEWSVWTGGAGEDDRSIFTDANWDGGTAPDLLSGNAKLRFPADSVVEIAEGAVARAYALDVQGALTMSGTGKLAVGAGGATVQTAEITIEPSVEFTEVPQTWNFVGTPKVTFNGSLGAHDGLPQDGKVFFLGDGNAKVKDGMGNVWFAAKCAEMMNAEVVVSNVLADIRHGEAFSRERGLTLWQKGYNFTENGCHLFKRGLTVQFPVRLYGHTKELIDAKDGGADNHLTFDEPVWFYVDKDVNVAESANITCRLRMTFNSPVVFEKQGTIYGGASGRGNGVFFNDTVTFGARYYASSAGSWVHFSKPCSWEFLCPNANGGLNIECLAENVLDPAKTIIYYYAGGVLELGGHDQTVASLWANYQVGGLAASNPCSIDSDAGEAVIHLTNPTAHNSNYAFYFTGKAGVDFQLATGKSVNLCNGTSKTKGPLILRGGTLSFTSTASTTGKWHGRGIVRIDAGAKIVTTLAETFGDAADGCCVKLEIAQGGTLELAADETVKSFTFNGIVQEPGTYGAPGSGAAHEMDCFAGTGILTVTSVPKPGIVLIVR